MKKRQIKKLNKKAMHLLMRLDPEFYNPDSFDYEDGVLSFWYECGGLETEWDYRPAYTELLGYVDGHLTECDWVEVDSETNEWDLIYKFTPDLSTAKKVFNLAKQLIEQSAGGAA